jgi:hypothetical protein
MHYSRTHYSIIPIASGANERVISIKDYHTQYFGETLNCYEIKHH